MTTPEGAVKDKIRGLLRKYDCYWLQPVQTGYGVAGLDFHCMTAWRSCAIAFFVEAKKPGGILTERQKFLIDNLKSRWNANVFVIENEEGLTRLEKWLKSLQDQKTLLEPRTFNIQTS
jgi:hypothetical protein